MPRPDLQQRRLGTARIVSVTTGAAVGAGALSLTVAVGLAVTRTPPAAATTPGTSVGQNSAPQNGSTQNPVPQNSAPQNSAPQNSAPQDGGGVGPAWNPPQAQSQGS